MLEPEDSKPGPPPVFLLEYHHSVSEYNQEDHNITKVCSDWKGQGVIQIQRKLKKRWACTWPGLSD